MKKKKAKKIHVCLFRQQIVINRLGLMAYYTQLKNVYFQLLFIIPIARN